MEHIRATVMGSMYYYTKGWPLPLAIRKLKNKTNSLLVSFSFTLTRVSWNSITISWKYFELERIVMSSSATLCINSAKHLMMSTLILSC